jgi:hypothetical protein
LRSVEREKSLMYMIWQTGQVEFYYLRPTYSRGFHPKVLGVSIMDVELHPTGIPQRKII